MKTVSSFLCIFLLAAGISGCRDPDQLDQEEVNRKRLQISKEVKDSLQGEIVCYSGNGIIKIGAKNHISTQIGTNAIGAPEWSPDGSEIAFIRLMQDSPDSAHWYLTIANKEGVVLYDWLLGSSTKIINIRALTWSPGGEIIAVLCDDNKILYVETATGETTLTQLAPEYGYYYTLAWWPNGNKIAISSGLSIWIFEAFGSDPRNSANLLITSDENSLIGIEYMDWSMDGSMLAYSGVDCGSIFIINHDGTDNREIILKEPFQDEEIYGFAPCWASNNKQIIYTSLGEQIDFLTWYYGLYVTDIDGSYKVNLNIRGNFPDWY